MESRIYDLEVENDLLRQKVLSLEQNNEDGISADDKTIRNLNSKINDLEQQGRKNSVRLFGLANPDRRETTEQCVKKIVDVVNKAVKVNITPSDIDIAHRLGRFNTHKPRAVICKFTHRRTKFEVLRNRKNLKGTRMAISEDLTTENNNLLIKVKRMTCVKSAWTIDGKIWALLSNDKKIRITHDISLNEGSLLESSNRY